MSYTSLLKGSFIIASAIGVSACSTLEVSSLPTQRIVVNDDVLNKPAILTPCTSVGIKPRPARMVEQQEFADRYRAGETGYFYNGYYLFSKRSLVEQYAPAAGAILIGTVGYGIGGGVGRAVATGAGVSGGAVLGEWFADGAKVKRLAHEAGCEAFLDEPAPQPDLIDMNRPADRPVGAIPRGLEGESRRLPQYQIGPYSATSPGGSRDPNRSVIPSGRRYGPAGNCFGC